MNGRINKPYLPLTKQTYLISVVCRIRSFSNASIRYELPADRFKKHADSPADPYCQIFHILIFSKTSMRTRPAVEAHAANFRHISSPVHVYNTKNASRPVHRLAPPRTNVSRCNLAKKLRSRVIGSKLYPLHFIRTLDANVQHNSVTHVTRNKMYWVNNHASNARRSGSDSPRSTSSGDVPAAELVTSDHSTSRSIAHCRHHIHDVIHP